MKRPRIKSGRIPGTGASVSVESGCATSIWICSPARKLPWAVVSLHRQDWLNQSPDWTLQPPPLSESWAGPMLQSFNHDVIPSDDQPSSWNYLGALPSHFISIIKTLLSLRKFHGFLSVPGIQDKGQIYIFYYITVACYNGYNDKYLSLGKKKQRDSWQFWWNFTHSGNQ